MTTKQIVDKQLEKALEDWHNSKQGAKCPCIAIDAEIERKKQEVLE